MKFRRILSFISLLFVCVLFVGCDSGNVKKEEQPEKHNMKIHYAKEATCTSDGCALYYECTDCGKYFLDNNGEKEVKNLSSLIINKTGHNMGVFPAVDPTCTTDGNIHYYHCDKCDKYFINDNGFRETTDSVIIEKLGHSITEHKAVSATCTAEGCKAYYECTTCNKLYSDRE